MQLVASCRVEELCKNPHYRLEILAKLTPQYDSHAKGLQLETVSEEVLSICMISTNWAT
jgi:hypothetical protein